MRIEIALKPFNTLPQAWGFLDPNIWGAKQGRSQNFGSGKHQQNFIYEFLSRFVLQWRRQNFGSGETFSKNVLIKDI